MRGNNIVGQTIYNLIFYMPDPNNYSYAEDAALHSALSVEQSNSNKTFKDYKVTAEFVEQTSMRAMERLGIDTSRFTIPFSEAE